MSGHVTGVRIEHHRGYTQERSLLYFLRSMVIEESKTVTTPLNTRPVEQTRVVAIRKVDKVPDCGETLNAPVTDIVRDNLQNGLNWERC